jgi:hypothetical protein
VTTVLHAVLAFWCASLVTVAVAYAADRLWGGP